MLDIYEVLQSIQNSEVKTSNEIMDEFALKGETITQKRIIKIVKLINDFSLEKYGYKLIQSSTGKGYSMEKGVFEQGELQFLIDSIASNKDLNQLDKEKLIHKITSFASYLQLVNLNLNLSPSVSEDSLLNSLSTISKAIELQRQISFRYTDYIMGKENEKFKKIDRKEKNGKVKIYKVSPYRIAIDRGHYYVIGYQHGLSDKENIDSKQNKDFIRVFRIDRMSVVTSKNDKRGYNAALLDSIDFNEIANNSMNMYVNGKNPQNITLNFDESIIRVMVSQFPDNMIVKAYANGKYKVRIENVKINEGLIQWLLMLGSKVEVISPESFRQQMFEEINKLYTQYQKRIG